MRGINMQSLPLILSFSRREKVRYCKHLYILFTGFLNK